MWHLRGLAIFAGSAAVMGLGSFGRRSVPGAGDNLASCGILVHAAGRLRERIQAEPESLSGTRIILASFDAEEAGLRGSRAFARDNRTLLTSLPTAVLNLESLFRIEDLSALRVDLQGLVPLSHSLAKMLTEEGRAEGIEVRPMKLIFGMGATDAAEFARLGIAATTLVAVPHGSVGRIVYHTRHDLVENLEPSVIDAVVRLVLRMIDRFSREPATAFAGGTARGPRAARASAAA